jgi:hypothetical protein
VLLASRQRVARGLNRQQSPEGEIMKFRPLVALALLMLASGAMASAPTNPVPEPGVLELLGVGAIGALAVALRKRRK